LAQVSDGSIDLLAAHRRLLCNSTLPRHERVDNGHGHS
jgi:hypothetical protein